MNPHNNVNQSWPYPAPASAPLIAPTKPTGRSKVAIGLALALLAILIGLCQYILSHKDGGGKHDMARVAQSIGRGLPRMIDSETRWDSVTSDAVDTLTYNYTMVHYT